MLLAIHGFTETDEGWRRVLEGACEDIRWHLLPGHGGLPCRAGTTVATEAARVASLMPEGGGDLVAYSMGGRIALRAALDHPQRIRRLVLVSATPGIRDDRERQVRRRKDEALAQILDEDGIGPFVAWWENNPALKPVRSYPVADARAIRSVRLNQDPRGLAGAMRAFGQGVSEDLRPRLSALRIPVLCIVGEADTPYVALGREMVATIPGARLECVAEAGHAVHREQPTVVRHLVRSFLRNA